MGLSGQQCKQLQDALIDAFPTMASLEQMLAFGLDKNLRAIAGEGSLQEIVFKLIQVADSQGWIINLICEACNHNPENPQLDSIVQDLIINNSSTLYNRIEESLKDEYSKLYELGSGVTGATYRAKRKNDQKLIVIKTIKSELLYQWIKSANQEDLKELDDAIRNFTTEAEVLSKFKHPYIISYYAHLKRNYRFLIDNPDKKPDNKPYLVRKLSLLFLIMEYIEGETLEEFLSKKDTPLQQTEALHYIEQIGAALTFVHNKGVLHRDIKPQNIMVRETRKTTFDAVLIDFGIAREFDSKVIKTHTVAYTIGYAPPEQLEQRAKRGNYTDVYGLAATLYYLLTKEHPTHAMLRKSDSSSLVEPKKINSNISDTVNKAILWGMELEYSKRPQTVQEWLAKLLSKETPFELTPSQEVSAQSSILEPSPAEQQQREQEQAEYENNLRLYEQEFANKVQAEYPLSQPVLQRLQTYQQQLGLNNEDVERVEQPIREPAEAKYQEKLRQEAEQRRREQEYVDPTTTTNPFERIFKLVKSSTQQRKILPISAAVVVVFAVLIAYGTTHEFFKPATDTQPKIASSSPKNSTNPSKPEQPSSVDTSLNSTVETPPPETGFVDWFVDGVMRPFRFVGGFLVDRVKMELDGVFRDVRTFFLIIVWVCLLVVFASCSAEVRR